ncbi:MAG: hypothetical protein ACI85O_000869 [Saprospiraceae bacterium]|jgi:hypothetical protein
MLSLFARGSEPHVNKDNTKKPRNQTLRDFSNSYPKQEFRDTVQLKTSPQLSQTPPPKSPHKHHSPFS